MSKTHHYQQLTSADHAVIMTRLAEDGKEAAIAGELGRIQGPPKVQTAIKKFHTKTKQ